MNLDKYQSIIRSVNFGKKLPTALYIHVDGFKHLPSELQQWMIRFLKQYNLNIINYQVIKFSTQSLKFSLLNYPDFFAEPFPELVESYTLDFSRQTVRHKSYKKSINPPILHRKELFLPFGHSSIPECQLITEAAEKAGLFKNVKTIGFKQNWEKLMREKKFNFPRDSQPNIQRHLTAINRNVLSRPMQTLFRNQFLDGKYSIFDYGCGKGDDLRELRAHNVESQGFDPVYAPNNPKVVSDVVNLGFVINVIENPKERAECLREAFLLSRRLLVVSAMLANEVKQSRYSYYGDGVVTKRNTFQKYYSQMELKNYLESILQTNAIAVAGGIFYVFRDTEAEQLFLIQRQQYRQWTQLTQHPRPTEPVMKRATLFEQHENLLQAFWMTCLKLGRCPKQAEFTESETLQRAVGSFRKAYQLVCQNFGKELIQQAEQARRDDLLVYFALNLFEKHKPYQKLPEWLKQDIKSFFGDYKMVQQQAHELLFSVGRTDVIREACIQAQQSGIGYLFDEHSLQLHTSQVNQLPKVLRVYVGCATQLYGDIEEADLVKLHINSGKVSLMRYASFEETPLPILQERIKIKLRNQEIDFFDYTDKQQLLYLKSRYIPENFPNYMEQKNFDMAMEQLKPVNVNEYSIDQTILTKILRERELIIKDWKLLCKKV